MSESKVKNVVASVLARLRNHAKSTGAPFQQVLQLYTIERFLYRISKSKHAESVVLKGAVTESNRYHVATSYAWIVLSLLEQYPASEFE